MKLPEILSLPTIIIIASNACNLSCAYCSGSKTKLEEDYLEDQNLANFISHIQPSHIYISGGEPTIHPGLINFCRLAVQNNHKISIETNSMLSIKTLNQIIDNCREDNIASIRMTQHIGQTSFKHILDRALLLKERGVRQFVKFIGMPGYLEEIRSNMEILIDKEIGTCVTPLFYDHTKGNIYNGKFYPKDYTDQELIQLLDMFTTYAHGIQLFHGILSRGMMCKAGYNYIVVNQNLRKEICRCGNDIVSRVNMDNTVFADNNIGGVRCAANVCTCDSHFMYNINRIMDEKELLDRISLGYSEFLGGKSVLSYIKNNLLDRNIALTDSDTFERCKRLLMRDDMAKSIVISSATGKDIMAKLNILILLNCPTDKLRATVNDLIHCYEKYSQHNIYYLNYYYSREFPSHLETVKFDLVIFHTVFLSARYNLSFFKSLISSEHVQYFKNMEATKIVLPQDEHYAPEVLCDFINDFGISHVFSVAPESEWPKIYRTVNFETVKFHRVLTGYIDDDAVSRIEKITSFVKERNIDIGYRCGTQSLCLGRHSLLKTQIAELFQKEAVKKKLLLDISMRPEDTFLGGEWYEFLSRCKYCLGAESGASLLDWDGSVFYKTQAYISSHPEATFEEVESVFFPGMDGNIKYFALSPRNLEACITRTCQILTEGDYNRILEPDKHYIALKKDFSNIEEVLDIICEDKVREEITERAYCDIVESGEYSYKNFVEYVISQSLSEKYFSSSLPRTATDDYWSKHTVRSSTFNSASDSLEYLKWRFNEYPLYQELMGLYGEHDNQVILDYGCGPGDDVIGFLVHTNAKKVMGIDISEKALALAKLTISLHNINSSRVELLQVSDSIPKIPIMDCSVDYIYSQGVLHHTSDPFSILQELFRILKPNSKACIMVYNFNSLWFHLYTAYYKVIIKNAFPGLTIYEAFSKNTDGEACPISRCYTDDEFSIMCRNAGFECEYMGGYLSRTELHMWQHFGHKAINDERLAITHRDFLRNIVFDSNGYPLYQGKYAGIGGVYQLYKYLPATKAVPIALSQESLRESCDQLKKAIKIAPTNPEIPTQLGFVYYQMAKQSFHEALSLEPTHLNALMTLGGMARIQGNFKEADQFYNKLVQTHPDHLDGWIAYGRLALEMMDYKGARALFQRALTLAPNRTDIQQILERLSKANI